MTSAALPVPTQVLLTNLDLLARSVDTANLSTAIDELGKAFNGRGPDVQRLLDSGDELLTSAEQDLPQTIALINSSKTVLQTQLDEGPAIASWAHDLILFSAQLKASDNDVRTLLEASARPDGADDHERRALHAATGRSVDGARRPEHSRWRSGVHGGRRYRLSPREHPEHGRHRRIVAGKRRPAG
jgi:hypothetical protein